MGHGLVGRGHGLLCTYGAVPSLGQRLALKQRQALFDKLVDDAMVDTRDAIRLLEPRMDVRAMKSTFPVAKLAASRASANLDAFMFGSTAPARAATQRSLTTANAGLTSLLQAEFPVLDRMLELRLSDYDRFKEINTYGHLAGDELLIRLARTIEELANANAFWNGSPRR
jgi:GGDEF domain-containing protein